MCVWSNLQQNTIDLNFSYILSNLLIEIPHHQLVVLFFGNLRQEDSLKRLFGKAKTKCLAGPMDWSTWLNIQFIAYLKYIIIRSLNLLLAVSLNSGLPLRPNPANPQVPRSLELAWPFSAAWQSWIRFLKLGDIGRYQHGLFPGNGISYHVWSEQLASKFVHFDWSTTSKPIYNPETTGTMKRAHIS